jgi:hypothetical protein
MQTPLRSRLLDSLIAQMEKKEAGKKSTNTKTVAGEGPVQEEAQKVSEQPTAAVEEKPAVTVEETPTATVKESKLPFLFPRSTETTQLEKTKPEPETPSVGFAKPRLSYPFAITKPTQPEIPTQPAATTQPEAPAESAPTQPAAPILPEGPATSTKPTEPAKPTEAQPALKFGSDARKKDLASQEGTEVPASTEPNVPTAPANDAIKTKTGGADGEPEGDDSSSDEEDEDPVPNGGNGKAEKKEEDDRKKAEKDCKERVRRVRR